MSLGLVVMTALFCLLVTVIAIVPLAMGELIRVLRGEKGKNDDGSSSRDD